MRNSIKLLFFVVVLPAMVLLTGCKDDEPTVPTQSEFEKLTDYMLLNNLDLPSVLDGWVIPAHKLELTADNAVDGYVVLDIRSEDHFNTGHIKDAINTPVADILEVAANNGGKTAKFLVVCYSGQTAGRAVGALRLMGYENAKSLKWGMSGWHQDFADMEKGWENKVADLDHSNWIKSGDPEPVKDFALPNINTGGSTGETILELRVRTMLANSSWIIGNTDVLDNPQNYFINNKWSISSWDAYGHITGAYRIDEDLKIANLKNLDPSTTMITYCYTGQTSAITTLWLQVLGYDNARSLKFGVNAINYTEMKNGSVAAKTWKGEGSSSGNFNNFKYYDSDGNIHG